MWRVRLCGCSPAQEQQHDIHTGCWWHSEILGTCQGMAEEEVQTAQPHSPPIREQEHLNPSDVPLPHVRESLLCCATAQGHPETTLPWLLFPQGAGGLGLPADPS